MKIYNKIVFDMTTMDTIEEDSFEYHGDIIECKGGSTVVQAPAPVKPAGPSPQEVKIQEAQLAAMEKQAQMQEQLTPYLLASSGYLQDPEGNITRDPAYEAQIAQEQDIRQQGLGFQQEQMEMARQNQAMQAKMMPFMLESMGYQTDPTTGEISRIPVQEQEPDELSKQLYENALAASRGELPVSAGVTGTIGKQRQKLQEDLSRRLGSSYADTTPGIQSLQEFDKNAEMLKSDVQRGLMTDTQAMTNAREGLMAGLGRQDMGDIQSLLGGQPFGLQAPGQSGAQRFSMASGIPGMFGNVSAGYGGLLQPYQAQRGMEMQGGLANASNQMQASMTNAKLAGQRESGMLSTLGTAGGIAGGYYLLNK